MNTMKTLFFAVVAMMAALTLSSCGSKNAKQAEVAVTDTIPVVLTVDDVLANADSLKNTEITVEGICTHICQHGGKKIFLMGSNDSISLRCEADDKIGQFNPDVVNNLVQVTGILEEERIDEAYLAEWEEMLKAETAEKHGEDTEAGCATEKKNRGEEAEADTPEKRIAAFRERIAQREAEEGKNYLSFYYLNANQYEVK